MPLFELDKRDIKYSKNNEDNSTTQIRQASVERLLEKLADFSIFNLEYLNTLLTTYRLFTTPNTIVQALRHIYQQQAFSARCYCLSHNAIDPSAAAGGKGSGSKGSGSRSSVGSNTGKNCGSGDGGDKSCWKSNEGDKNFSSFSSCECTHSSNSSCKSCGMSNFGSSNDDDNDNEVFKSKNSWVKKKKKDKKMEFKFNFKKISLNKNVDATKEKTHSPHIPNNNKDNKDNKNNTKEAKKKGAFDRFSNKNKKSVPQVKQHANSNTSKEFPSPKYTTTKASSVSSCPISPSRSTFYYSPPSLTTTTNNNKNTPNLSITNLSSTSFRKIKPNVRLNAEKEKTVKNIEVDIRINDEIDSTFQNHPLGATTVSLSNFRLNPSLCRSFRKQTSIEHHDKGRVGSDLDIKLNDSGMIKCKSDNITIVSSADDDKIGGYFIREKSQEVVKGDHLNTRSGDFIKSGPLLSTRDASTTYTPTHKTTTTINFANSCTVSSKIEPIFSSNYLNNIVATASQLQQKSCSSDSPTIINKNYNLQQQKEKHVIERSQQQQLQYYQLHLQINKISTPVQTTPKQPQQFPQHSPQHQNQLQQHKHFQQHQLRQLLPQQQQQQSNLKLPQFRLLAPIASCEIFSASLDLNNTADEDEEDDNSDECYKGNRTKKQQKASPTQTQQQQTQPHTQQQQTQQHIQLQQTKQQTQQQQTLIKQIQQPPPPPPATTNHKIRSLKRQEVMKESSNDEIEQTQDINKFQTTTETITETATSVTTTHPTLTSFTTFETSKNFPMTNSITTPSNLSPTITASATIQANTNKLTTSNLKLSFETTTTSTTIKTISITTTTTTATTYTTSTTSNTATTATLQKTPKIQSPSSLALPNPPHHLPQQDKQVSPHHPHYHHHHPLSLSLPPSYFDDDPFKYLSFRKETLAGRSGPNHRRPSSAHHRQSSSPLICPNDNTDQYAEGINKYNNNVNKNNNNVQINNNNYSYDEDKNTCDFCHCASRERFRHVSWNKNENNNNNNNYINNNNNNSYINNNNINSYINNNNINNDDYLKIFINTNDSAYSEAKKLILKNKNKNKIDLPERLRVSRDGEEGKDDNIQNNINNIYSNNKNNSINNNIGNSINKNIDNTINKNNNNKNNDITAVSSYISTKPNVPLQPTASGEIPLTMADLSKSSHALISPSKHSLIHHINTQQTPPSHSRDLSRHNRMVVSRVLKILNHWIGKHFQDFESDELLRGDVLELLNEISSNPQTLPKEQRNTNNLINAINIAHPLFNVPAYPPPPTSASCQEEYELERIMAAPLHPSKEDFESLSAQDLAEQMTFLDHKLFVTIKNRELLGQAWMKVDKVVKSPHVLLVSKRFNEASKLVVCEIVRRQTVNERVACIEKWTHIADLCRCLNNFNGLLQVCAAFVNSAVYRLRKTWDKLQKNTKQKIESLQKLVSSDGRFRNMREAVHNCERPCIPYLGMYLTDLSFIEEGSSNVTDDGLINFSKMRMISSVITEIQFHQQSRYNIQHKPKVTDYLLDGERLMSEDAAFRCSLDIEPRIRASISSQPP